METEHRYATCKICSKPIKYNRTVGYICWKCKREREESRAMKKPVRCKTCGHLITIVPCVGCKMQGMQRG
jgi:hypothetical protein